MNPERSPRPRPATNQTNLRRVSILAGLFVGGLPIATEAGQTLTVSSITLIL